MTAGSVARSPRAATTSHERPAETTDLRRRTAWVSERRTRACRRPRRRPHDGGQAAARRPRHRDLHDGARRCGTASGRRRCTTRVVLDGRRAVGAARTVPLASRADARVLAWQSGERLRLRRRHPRRLPAESATRELSLRCTASAGSIADHILGPGRHRCNSGHLLACSSGVVAGARRIAASCSATPMAPAGHAVSSGRLRALTPDEAEGLDSYSPAYGHVESALCLTDRTVASMPHTEITFISGLDTSEVPVLQRLQVTELPPPGWHAAAFRLRWLDAEAVLLWAIETSPLTSIGGSPGAIWGTRSGCNRRPNGRCSAGWRQPSPAPLDTRHANPDTGGWPDPCIAQVPEALRPCIPRW